jgi:predicted TPR repeat methyltransferase
MKAEIDAGEGTAEAGLEPLFAQAAQLFERGDLVDAAAAFRACLVLDPDNVSAHNMLGNILHEQGDATEAERAYRKALTLDPDDPLAHYNLGNVVYAQGDLEEAVRCYERSVEGDARNPAVHYNLGNALYYLGRLPEALVAYLRSVDLDPDDHAGQFNLANTLCDLGCFREAIARYRCAIELSPGLARAHGRLGHALVRTGRWDEGIESYRRAVALDEDATNDRTALAKALLHVGRLDDALAQCQILLEAHPGHPILEHMAASCRPDRPPDRASDAYVTQLFDDFADTFDRNLANLAYAAPALVAAVIEEASRERGPLTVLDAGCGTGLCGPRLRSSARRLVGVDLSSRMLEKAGERNVYDELEQAELTSYLRGHPRRFNAIVAADVLVYFGDIAPFAGAAAFALEPRGILVFTVEHLAGEGEDPAYRLLPHGRYCHREGAVRFALEGAGLEVRSLDAVILRTEAGEPVTGLLAVATRPA